MARTLALIACIISICAVLALAGHRKPSASDAVQKEFDAWNAHDAEKVAALFTDDAVYEDVTYGEIAHGHDELKKLAAGFFTAVPDLKLELVAASREGEHGSAEWKFSGTDVGLYKTGKKFSVRGASLFTMRGAQFSANKDFYDSASIMRQVGVLPSPEGPANSH
jgi:steroid delta-isomerase-like uncharacterized protein